MAAVVLVETAVVVSRLVTVGMALGYGAKKGYDFAKSKKESKKCSKKSTSEVEARLVDDSDLSDDEGNTHEDEYDETKEKKSIKVLGVPLYDRESSTENNSRTVKVLGITVFDCKDTTAKGTKDTNSKKKCIIKPF